jgi:serine/threonine protein kinase
MFAAIRDRRVLATYKKTYPEFQTLSEKFSSNIGSGASGVVYSMSGDPSKVIKLQKLRFPLFKKSEASLTEEDLYEINQETIIATEPALIENIVMTDIVSMPKVHDFGIVYGAYPVDSQMCWFSFMVMDRVPGIPLIEILNIKPFQTNKSYYLKVYKMILEKMKMLWDKYQFTHGDLNIRGNLLMDQQTGEAHIIDFGTASFIFEGYHIYPRHILERYTKASGKQSTELMQGVDICKILQVYNGFSREFEEKLNGCSGNYGQSRPPLVIFSKFPLEYNEALNEVERAIGSINMSRPKRSMKKRPMKHRRVLHRKNKQ